jgi:Ribbon-helix-helix protein, copG family
MRTTVTLEDDVAAEVRRLSRERGMGVSEALNRLARAGLMAKSDRPLFRQRTAHLALQVDVTNVAEALEALDGPRAR